MTLFRTGLKKVYFCLMWTDVVDLMDHFNALLHPKSSNEKLWP